MSSFSGLPTASEFSRPASKVPNRPMIAGTPKESATPTPASEPAMRVVPARGWRSFGAWMLSNVWMTLCGLLGIMQALAVQWWLVVVAGGEGLNALGVTALGASLLGLNLASLPTLRRARLGGGRGRLAARLYMGFGIVTILIGVAIAASWIGLFPLSKLAGGLGLGADAAFLSFRIGSVLLVATVLGMAVWAFTGGQQRVERTHIQVPLPGLHEDHRGLRLCHLTDLHVGNGLEGERLSKMVARANALEADIIVLTGDIFDFDPSYVEDGARRLGALSARLGVYAVLGNHDTYTGAEEVVAAFAEQAPGIRVLRDEWERLPLAAPLYIAGIEDPGRGWTSRNLELPAMEDLSESLPEDGPSVLLVHRPQAFPQAVRLGFPLVLAGHTHGGQLALPLPGGRYNLALVMTGFTRGLYASGGSTMYVNRGIGVAGPAIRFNCRREMATLELV
jgi:predicted MPP superfamily phosphohydrolase